MSDRQPDRKYATAAWITYVAGLVSLFLLGVLGGVKLADLVF